MAPLIVVRVYFLMPHILIIHLSFNHWPKATLGLADFGVMNVDAVLKGPGGSSEQC